ncbi:mitochondrial protein Pet127-domain-containing protein, partial [Fomitopsis betulina]
HCLTIRCCSPGVHWLTEPRSKFDNFASYLKEVPSVSEFAFERLTGFVTSSRDSELLSLAKSHECKFAGSTSSLTGMLSLIYLLMAEERPIDVSTLSAHYQDEPKSFTPGQRMPVSVTLRYIDGVYATDSHVEHLAQLGSTDTILSQLGTVMEKFFTMNLEKFKAAYMKTEPVTITQKGPWLEAYRYARHNKFLMRSQLDCYSDCLPGSGIFDIKTRAAVPIRYDIERYRASSPLAIQDHISPASLCSQDSPEDYRIRTVQGAWMSFEKEYYDLIRSAFLKYSFQARIGDMDGVFVAYHNTREIFGFQYIPLEEMDQRLYGHSNGQRVFGKCVGLLDVLFTEITKYFPEERVNCTFETDIKHNVMHVWIEPAEWEESKRPIVQLDVRLRHYLGREKVSGSEAVGSRTGGCKSKFHPTLYRCLLTDCRHARDGCSTQSRDIILRRRRAAFQTQMRIYKFGLSPNERVERQDDVDPSHVD